MPSLVYPLIKLLLISNCCYTVFSSTRISRAPGANAFDLTKMLATEDWFSSISPQIMKRILNVVSLTGRLLRANRLQVEVRISSHRALDQG